MNWNWPTTDIGRADRARKVKIISMDLNSENPNAVFKGSGGEYSATLEQCSCPDFSININKGKPQACKHMIRLAMECGILNENGLRPIEQRQVDIEALETRLSRYAWHYYVLDDPQISDREYDSLKAEYMKLRK